MKIGIAGAGLLGRLLALQLLQHGFDVTLYDQDDNYSGQASCGLAAAGMLSPYAEIETASSSIFNMGMQSIALWPRILQKLNCSECLEEQGSLVLAHRQDWPDLQHFVRMLEQKLGKSDLIQFVNKQQLQCLESQFNSNMYAYYFPQECSINVTALFAVLEKQLLMQGVNWHLQAKVLQLRERALELKQQWQQFDWVFDCRGLGGQEYFTNLRGVRGELLWLYAPNVRLNRPLRLLHPRYRLYIVPRPDNIFVVGATEIESDDMSEISVRSCLELLSAAYSIHPGFAEARIIKTVVNCRPALPDNMPILESKPGITRINGLYRHGYLLAPVLVQQAVAYLMENLK